ncbi:MAG: HAD-IA family hydrolase [Ornithinimicrobium sp.]
MSAVLFGSISTLADTSELQRDAFNRAFEAHDLDWTWDRETYLEMLDTNGGKDRIASYASSRSEDVDAEAVHATKSQIFQESLASADVSPREGVVETIATATDQGASVALVTTTSAQNIDALLTALRPDVKASHFHLVVDATDVDQGKPNPAAYTHALQKLGVTAGECVAIEDNVGGLQAAQEAGITCVAFPNSNTAGHDFESAAARVDRLDSSELLAMTSGTGS